MAQLHQIYGTHCTYSTSAIEKRTGEMADRVLGYSARASSIDKVSELRQFYRAIERFTYYYLPTDVPPEKKAVFTASSAPRRLVYHPATSGLRMAAHICYRQFDCAGRPGSY